MERATIAELKNHLSAYLRKVKAGETVVVLERDRPIARLERISGADDPEGRLARLEAAGLIQRPVRPLRIEALREPAPGAGRGVLEALLRERREGR